MTDTARRHLSQLPSLSLVLTILIAFGAVLSLLALGNRAFASDDPDIVFGTSALIGTGQTLVFFLALATFAAWNYRAHAALQPLHARLATDPRWAVRWLFVPVANLWKPYTMMGELERASRRAQGWRELPVDPLVHAWWGVWLVAHGLWFWRLVRVGIIAGAPGADDLSPLVQLDLLETVYQISWIAAGVLLVLLTRRVHAQLAAQHEEFARRLAAKERDRRELMARQAELQAALAEEGTLSAPESASLAAAAPDLSPSPDLPTAPPPPRPGPTRPTESARLAPAGQMYGDPVPQGAAPRRFTRTSGDYQSLARSTPRLRFFLGLMLVLTLVSLGSSYLQLQLLEGPEFTEEEGIANDLREQLVGVLTIVFLLITAIVFGRWIIQGHKNLRALGVQDLTFTPGWAVGWFFVPILNLWKPYQAMAELWRASHDPFDWRNAPLSPILTGWWFVWVLSTVSGRIVWRMTGDAETVEEWITVTRVYMVDGVLTIISCIFAYLLVGAISDAQQASHRRGSVADIF